MSLAVTARYYRITPMDSPIGLFLPEDRQDWVVTSVSDRDMPDQEGTEVHRFRHWTVPNVYVRIKPPRKES